MRMRRPRPMYIVGAVLLATACSDPPYVPPEGLPRLFAAVEAAPALYELELDGCVRIHNVWKAQVRAIHRTAGGSIGDRVRMLRDSVYEPHAEFWDGYVGEFGGGFVSWARRELDLAGHARTVFPTQVDLPRLIADVTARVDEMTGLRGCTEWYLVYGPGWVGMGGLSDGRMIVDFFGSHSSPEDMRWPLPHEVAHVVRRQEAAAESRDLLAVIVDEGLAEFFSATYWRDEKSAADLLWGSDSDWNWAVTHESELWRMASEQLNDTSRAVIDRYQRADQRLHPDGPTNVGYFLGYRIVEAYIARHGRDALADLFRLPARRILDDSGYSPLAGPKEP